MNAYQQVVLGITIGATAVFLFFLVLVLRRYIGEKRAALLDARDTAITRSYLHRVAGHKVDDPKKWNAKAQLAAVTRILPLLRGGEKTRLLQIAELDGVLSDTLYRSHGIYKKDRVNAVHLLQRVGSEACIGRLRELMARDRNDRVRLEAAFGLAANAALPPPRETLRILGAMDRPPARIDIALLRSTAPLYPDQMLLLLDDDLDSAWRARIIDALGWSESLAVIDAVKNAAVDPNPEVRNAALRASAKLGHPAAADWILPALEDPVHSVRLQAIRAAVQLNLKQALPVILQLRNDDELWVRLRAEEAIEHLDPSLLSSPGDAKS
ncbi:HEAT repeat domain-containing protein [Qipengyuania sp. NPDC077563]|uniref:HEAT repeat domain-containing protein n=1 Tax=Qipengyuania sp. NPDC077563 TaxID=3364497 RepID=UPI00384CCDFC